ncbi:hypothetical protein Patl1_17321 [Pistacia atlantica]|uniref:Uncharacterized protein n=1 Tax=Pistacia atlantica TaxID=434234 RepID=A0ACC1B759_9ROSI|nr:hypothetical protein Patl1_17321 [Pistacia atlantica]
MAPFIKKLSLLVRPLQAMLKKNPPPWGLSQTTSIQRLKEITLKLPPYRFP